MKRWIPAFALGILISALTTHAHHSITGVYDSSQQVTVDGIVTHFQFVNPHPFVTLDVPHGSGGSQEWQLEMDNRRELVRIGLTGETLRKGDRIIVTGWPSRAQSERLYIQRLDRPADGFGYEQVRNSPRLRSRSR